MPKPKRKNFFAQNGICTATGHRAKAFHELEEAIEWLKTVGGGTVKERNKGCIIDPFVGPIRGWGVVASVSPTGVVTSVSPEEEDDDEWQQEEYEWGLSGEFN